MKISAKYLLLSFFTAGLLVSCQSKDQAVQENQISSLPPSLTANQPQKAQIIEISGEQEASLKISTYTIKDQHSPVTIIAPGEVFAAPNYIAVISAPVEGRVLKMHNNEGDPVSKGQLLMELESLTYGNLVAAYLQAEAEEQYQQSQLSRIRQLVEKGINPESELDKVKADYARAQADLRAAFARLKAVGTTDSDIQALSENDKITPHLKILSPINGSIDSHNVELGKAVSVNEQLATVMNLQKVLVKAFVAPEDGRLIAPGDSIKISHRLIDHENISGVISSLNPGLDQRNKSVVVNAFLDNPSEWLKPGDILRTTISTRVTKPVINIPIKAITYDNNDPIVFVWKDDNHYELRKITIDELRGDIAYVSSGLQAGEKVAVDQIFSLKALARFDLIAEE